MSTHQKQFHFLFTKIEFTCHENSGVRQFTRRQNWWERKNQLPRNTHTHKHKLNLDRSLLIWNCNFLNRLTELFSDEFYWLCVRNKFTTDTFWQIALFFIPHWNLLLLSCLIRTHNGTRYERLRCELSEWVK